MLRSGGVLTRFAPRAGARRRTLRRCRDAGPPRFGEADRDRLFGRPRAVFAFAYVIDFLTDEFAGLRIGGFSLAAIALHTLHCFLVRHGVTPP
jgi:hypothetical protein